MMLRWEGGPGPGPHTAPSCVLVPRPPQPRARLAQKVPEWASAMGPPAELTGKELCPSSWETCKEDILQELALRDRSVLRLWVGGGAHVPPFSS